MFAFMYASRLAFYHFLQFLPTNIGDGVYHRVQKKLGRADAAASYLSCQSTHQKAIGLISSHNIKIKHIVEIGSGWFPSLPLLFSQSGFVIDTYDTNHHMSNENIEKTEALHDGKSIGLKNRNVNYYPKTNVIEAKISNSSLVFSRFVLEHIPLHIISDIHNSFKAQGGHYVLHFISPSDHRSFVDKSYNNWSFLRWSNFVWDTFLSTRFDYHNRARLPEYLQLFTDLGYDCLSVDYNHNREAELPTLNNRFSRFSKKENTAGSIVLLLEYRP